jgi:hypothetical protein
MCAGAVGACSGGRVARGLCAGLRELRERLDEPLAAACGLRDGLAGIVGALARELGVLPVCGGANLRARGGMLERGRDRLAPRLDGLSGGARALRVALRVPGRTLRIAGGAGGRRALRREVGGAWIVRGGGG